MPIRMTGLVSGLDTESIIKELMSAQSTKKTKVQNKITKLEWKQEKWKDMNTKIYSFYTGSLSKARFQSNYQTMKATSSNQTKLDVTASSSATQGTHSIKVKELASAQFVTGTKLSGVQGDTKLSELGFDTTSGSTITIKSGTKTVNLDIGKNTTVNDFVQSCKNAGINATFDTTQQRFFLSSRETGVDNSFSMTMATSNDSAVRTDIRDFIGYSSLSSSDQSKADKILVQYLNDVYTDEDRKAMEKDLFAMRATNLSTELKKTFIENDANKAAAEAEARATLEAKLGDGETVNEEELKKLTQSNLAKNAETYVTELKDEYEAGNATSDTNPFQKAATDLSGLLTTYKSTDTTSNAVSSANGLGKLGLCNISDTTTEDEKKAVSFIAASDCTVIYNNAELKSSSNTITANGLTFTAKQVTGGLDTEDVSDDEVINISINKDTSAVYDMIKTFVKDYNELLKEMNTAYNAESARGYEPLTDEEKEAMSESQIEKWEDKIKDSLLRRDDQLSGVISAMRTALSGSVTVNGKSYSLSTFGITTTDYTEKGILHIYGDSDDPETSSNEDKLRAAIESDPDAVMEVMSKLAGNLYSSITDKMSTTSLSSALTVYNDKEMKSQITNYKSDLKTLEEKLKEIEDRYYKQFSAMETALSKLNSQTNQLSSLMGMNN